jgi:nicotinamidase-related amidase
MQMTFAFGKQIPTSIDVLLAERVALVIWDMQEGIARRAPNADAVVRNISRLADVARSRRVPVIYSQHTSLPLEAEAPGFIRTQWRAAGAGNVEELRPLALWGSESWQLIPEITPQSTDVVLMKYRRSFFVGTPLLEILHANDIQTLLLTGVATDRGILYTARDAISSYGVFPVVVTDAVGAFSDAQHQQGLRALEEYADLCTTTEVLTAWSS